MYYLHRERGGHKGRPYIILTSARIHCYGFSRCFDPLHRLKQATSIFRIEH